MHLHKFHEAGVTSMTPYVGVSTVIIAKSSSIIHSLKSVFDDTPNSLIFASIHFLLVAAASQMHQHAAS